MLILISIIMILFLLVHWTVLIGVLFTKETQTVKSIGFSLFCVEFVFVTGNLLVRFLI